MKSQVNALLYVTEGILTDVSLAYPELKDSLSKDFDRLTLYCRTRGQGIFYFDLPHLESLLLEALECGRLALSGPLSRAVSKRTLVPRLFSGLWLRVFNRDSSLRHEVDVNALFFLRQLCVVGKKMSVTCTSDRVQAKVGAYHDIERGLRHPSFNWAADDFALNRGEDGCSCEQHISPRNRGRYGRDLFDHGSVPHSLSEEISERVGVQDRDLSAVKGRSLPFDLMSVHIVQALDHVYPDASPFDSLFSNKGPDRKALVRDNSILRKIQKVADLIVDSFDLLDPVAFSGEIYAESKGIGFRHGPGAVAERLKSHEKSCFPNWPLKLQNTFPWDDCGNVPFSNMDRPLNHERASRLLCVPKTAKGPRLIAAEPTSHQWCQQLLRRYLENQCRKSFGTSFIDFKDQQKSGDLVLEASLNRELATVDLSDASDRLTCWTVERMFRVNPPLLLALHAARTRYIFDEVSDVSNFLLLRKFASQGTATTFPVMSLVMLFIALGCSIENEDDISWQTIKELRSQVRVFGDDIIIPKRGYADLVRAMDLLQLKVNKAKSYVNGHFRESCGSDGYMGYDVTPVKPETLDPDSPASCQAVVDTSNNLFNKGLFYASLAAENLLPLQVRKYLRVVGRHSAGFSGLTSFSGSDERHLRSRWNPRLHRTEVRVWSIRVQTQRQERGGFDALLDFFSRAHSQGNPRIVSEWVNRRNTKSRVLWEPQNSESYGVLENWLPSRL